MVMQWNQTFSIFCVVFTITEQTAQIEKMTSDTKAGMAVAKYGNHFAQCLKGGNDEFSLSDRFSVAISVDQLKGTEWRGCLAYWYFFSWES